MQAQQALETVTQGIAEISTSLDQEEWEEEILKQKYGKLTDERVCLLHLSIIENILKIYYMIYY